tara:strand:+ start:174 stop:1784 length:1611 start_codon:yes stop_codon:yes gene_type:complete
MATINNNPNINSSFFDVGRNVVPCKVKKIILDGSTPEAANFGGYDAIGTIFFTKIKATTETPYTDTDSNEKLELTIFDGVAKPLFPFIKYYPLINEIVPVITLTSKDYLNDRSEGEDNYYFPPINLWNHPHHNTLPSLDNYISSDKLSEIRKNEDYAQAGLLRRTTDGELDYEIPLGDYFNEQLNIKPLRPYEGDHILEGRFGNSIRLGATARSKVIPISQSNNWSAGAKGDIGDPITIIRNGQAEGLDEMGWVPTVEDINLDPSSIYLTSNQKIDNLIIAAPDCWYSFGLNADIPQDPNQEAKKFLNSPVDFIQAKDEETTEIEESNKPTIKTPPDNDRCPPGQVWDKELQACVLPEVTVEGSISEEEAGLNEEIIEEPQQYQQENELEELQYVDPNLPSSYQYADDSSEDSPVGYGEQCQLCVHFESWSSKKCNKWNAIVKPSFWCASFKERPPWWNFPGKYYKGYGIGEEYSEAENQAKLNAISDIKRDIINEGGENREYNIVFGESFQFSTPTRMEDGNLSVVMSYEVKSIS